MRGAAGRRRRSPEWGVSDLEAVADLATSAGFGAPSIHRDAAHNSSVLFRS
jgi:hypothetical protein